MTQKQEVPYWAEFIPSPRWVRAKIGTEIIADSKRVMLLRETGNLPTYYFPKEDVRTDLLQSSNKSVQDVRKGIAKYWTVKVGDRVAENAVWNYETLTPDAPDLKGYIAFEWEAMDAWFEEDDQIYRHARDPYKRIDVVGCANIISQQKMCAVICLCPVNKQPIVQPLARRPIGTSRLAKGLPKMRPGATLSHRQIQRPSKVILPLSGRQWMPGLKKMKRCMCMPAIPITGLMF